MVQAMSFPDKDALNILKSKYATLCALFLSGQITEQSLVFRAKEALKPHWSSYNLSLLFKRVEATCGKHICSFWKECDPLCQYNEEGLSWEDDISLFNRFDLRKKQSNLVQSNQQEPRIATLEAQMKEAQSTIQRLAQQLSEERNERLRLDEKIFRVQEKLVVIEKLYENYEAASTPGISSRLQLAPFHSIPIIDLSKSMAEIASSVGEACRRVGFMYVVNHNVPENLVQQAFDLAKAFFDLPKDRKQEISINNSNNGIRGYFELGQETLNSTRNLSAEDGVSRSYKGDYKEGFDCGREISSTDGESGYLSSMMHENIWPDESVLPYFREGVRQYESAISRVADKLMIAFAVALGLNDDFFIRRARRPMVTLRMLHYPPQEAKSEANLQDQIGCGAHTDYGLFTILNQDEVGGLQVLDCDKTWVDVNHIPKSFVINVGDMMSRWTNGMFSSTIHRVANVSGKERYSIPYFVNPDIGTIVDCLPTCLGPGEEPKFRPSTSDAILRSRYAESFDHISQS